MRISNIPHMQRQKLAILERVRHDVGRFTNLVFNALTGLDLGDNEGPTYAYRNTFVLLDEKKFFRDPPDWHSGIGIGYGFKMGGGATSSHNSGARIYNNTIYNNRSYNN